jgi:hypothetical protein
MFVILRSNIEISSRRAFMVLVALHGCMTAWFHRDTAKSISKNISKFYSLNHHLESHLHKKYFLYLVTFQQLVYFYAHSKEPFSFSIFD